MNINQVLNVFMNSIKRLLKVELNRGKFQSAFLLPVIIFGMALPTIGHAVTLEKVLFSKLPSNKVQINLSGSENFPEPKVFSTKDPARVVFDFFGMKSAVESPDYNIKIGAVDTLRVVQVADRTRIVMNLINSAPYDFSVAKDQFIIKVDPIAEEVNEKIEVKPFAKKSKLVNNKSIENIDFRRSEKGGGRIIVDLSDPNIVSDLRQVDGEIIIDFKKSKVPANLEKRLDVTDFATPVRAVDLFQNGENVRMIIEPAGEYQQISFQNENTFTVILDPIEEEKKEEEPDDLSGYTGERLSMNFQKLEVRSALSVISDFTGINIIASDDVAGDLTLNLKDVPWDQALDVILETKGLAKRQRGNVIWVAPAQRLAEFERLQLQASRTSEALEPLVSEVIEINYARAVDIRNVILEERNSNEDTAQAQQILLVQPGSTDQNNTTADNSASLQVTADERTNSLIVTTTASNLKSIKALIARLDSPVRQVMIETRIVQATDTFSKELGSRLGFERLVENTTAGVGNAASSSTIENANSLQNSLIAGAVGPTPNVNVDLGVSGAPSYAFSLFKAGTGYANIINLELSALEAEGRGKIVSSPRLVTSNQRSSDITTGTTRFITTGISPEGTPITETRDALLSMRVTPQITPDDNVVLEVAISQDTFLSNDVIRRNNINTQVTVENGETVIIGGIYEETQSDNVTKVPLLGDIPYLGRLFKRKSKQDNRSELLIFLTPKVINQELSIN